MAKRAASALLPRRVWRKPGLRRAALIFLVYAVLSVLLFFSLLPESIQLEVGQASPRYIGAPRTVEDQYTTAKLKEQAKQSVKDIFEQDPNVPLATSAEVNDIFNHFLNVAAATEDTQERLEMIRPQLSVDLNDDLLILGFSLNSDANSQLAGMLNQLLGEAYARGIKAEALAAAEEQLQRDIDRLYISEGQKSLLRQIGIQLLRPNMLYNASATEQLRQEAESRVLPVRVQKGQKIIGQGEIATEREIQLLEDLGLLRPALNWMLAAGAFAYMLMALLPIFLYLWLFREDVWRDNKQLVLIGLIILLTGVICRVSAVLSGYLLPVAMASILIAVLIGPRLGAVASVSMALIATALSGFEIATFGVSLAGGLAGAFGVSRMHQRFDLVRAGAVIAGTASLATLAFGMLLGTGWKDLLADVLGAAAGGVFSAILGFGVLPFLERPFGIASTIKLLELSNPNHPLLRRLLVEAPGTYNHSIIVANLAEAAAEAVGANGLLARVGSYYHDVGKIKRPYFFIENQFMMENPHDKYPPSLSTLVITSHVKDGVELVREYRLPEVLADMVRQHHGTTLVGYFYHKAKESCDVKEEDFRYPGPTPRTKEAAIIMLADSVEAAVRSLSQPTPGRIDNLVRKIIKERLNDGQLDECDITLRQLDKAGTAFVHILSGIFHKRVEYPEKLPDGEKVKVDDLDSK
ncbi:MAG: HD family phosphohydrolase [Bacillota bacterium]|jgi:putative nucleotidyltransferase with HDIG domain